MNYKTFELNSLRPGPGIKEFTSPAFESYVEKELDGSTFQGLTNDIKTKRILLVKDLDRQIGPDHFFVRGYRTFKKPFLFSFLAQFKYWHIVFDIEYKSKRVYTKYHWFDGNEESPVVIQDNTPNPTQNVKLKGEEILSKLAGLIKNFH